jgi:hypothetical protein
MQTMGRAARAEYEAKYTPEINYEMLMEIYKSVQHRVAKESTQSLTYTATPDRAAD